MKTLVKTLSGSSLYGTNVPGSDMDFRGVYLPTVQECLLTRVSDTVQDGTEEDTTYYSIQRFLDMAAEGQTISLEMLACPIDKQIETSDFWIKLHVNRAAFYTRNLGGMLEYARTQASRYGAKVERLRETEALLQLLSDSDNDGPDGPMPRLSGIWDLLPISSNAIKTTNDRSSNADKRVYQLCGRELQATLHIHDAFKVIQGIRDSYGERVRNAANMGEKELKSYMHAFRVAYQALEILETGDLHFPLKQAPWLTKLRLGQLDFVKDGLEQRLDDLIEEVNQKAAVSTLPTEVSRVWLDQLIIEAYE